MTIQDIAEQVERLKDKGWSQQRIKDRAHSADHMRKNLEMYKYGKWYLGLYVESILMSLLLIIPAGLWTINLISTGRDVSIGLFSIAILWVVFCHHTVCYRVAAQFIDQAYMQLLGFLVVFTGIGALLATGILLHVVELLCGLMWLAFGTAIPFLIIACILYGAIPGLIFWLLRKVIK